MSEEKINKTAPVEEKTVAVKAKKKGTKMPAFGTAHIYCSFNNTIVTISDDKGNTLIWSSAGSHGFKGSKKSTPFAAQITCSKVGEKAVSLGMREVTVRVCGPGQGRETAVRALQQAGLNVAAIRDVTPIPHNGCRPPKARRV
ncbi:Ribosomal protein S11 [Elusimicrobium minutum Pei191]|uniref:Small ribosomal subunit protein uS11 n=1 Tax=Elusimicrobium minutum (strain Pei191) TaxID=445932 RepID=B2KEJ5_ELUMP|nr:30S ribosomal protein S11 [Elusimicrobium minutum]ACC98941.1 Ribosomal protein S11 [Elusimicrobium minutum Pei191]